MKATTWGIIVLIAGVSGSAAAAERKVRLSGGSQVNVVLENRKQPAIGLRAAKTGWTLKIDGSADNAKAEFVDLTRGGAMTHWSADVDGRTLKLEAGRFRPDHAYHVEIRSGGQVLTSSVIYLYPPKNPKAFRVSFDDDAPLTGAASDNDPIAPIPKGNLF